jgi:hypothetical protein
MHSNFNNGDPRGGGLRNDARSGFVADQRVRLQYTAKANDDLKLVTHFELDTRFGGINDANYKGIPGGNDAGLFDADSISLETKHAYLDFNIPGTGVNAKVGIQPWADSYQTIFALADMTGVNLTKKFGPLATQLAWFRFDDNTTNGIAANSQFAAAGGTAPATAVPATNDPGKLTADLIVLDGKYAISKNLTVGASYYNIQRDTTTGLRIDNVELLHMIGLNASVKAGPATINPFFAYQFGDGNRVGTRETDLGGFLAGVTTKTKVGPGNINLSAIYLSGDDNATDDKNDDFKIINPAASYFNAANMWFLFRNPVGQNSNATITGNDVTLGGRGAMGVFAGYEGTVGKLFYDANVGWMTAAEERTNAGVKEDGAVGTEINAKVGYKMYDNLTASASAAYCILGDGFTSSTAGKRIGGANDADDPYLFNVMLQYVF